MSLSRRLALTLITLLVLLGAVIALVGRYASELYFHEVNQTLNASLSMYVVERLTLFEAADVNETAFLELADRAMTVNPSAEVYLLSTDGEIVAHALEDDVITHRRVDLAPIRAFLSGNNPGLILGSDPRSDRRKAFSASPILWNGELQGYLYVILGGRLFDEVRASFLGTFIGRMTIASLVAVLLVGGIAGYVALRSVTRPLESLAQSVARYRDSGFTDSKAIQEVPENTDEVDQLKHQILQLTERLAAQFDQLQTNDRLRRELLANISHDLRTPLTSTQGYLETLLIKGSTLNLDEQRRYLEIAHHKVGRLSMLVASLFELAKLDSGAIDPELDAFPIAELLHDVLQDFELDAADKGINLRVSGLESHSNLNVFADIRLIQRVLENLISNALRHTPPGGHIDIHLDKRRSAVAIDVRDDGSGIEHDLLPVIFDRYASGSDTNESTGLGLAIVKRILELHNSEIRVSSTAASGTCFSFELNQAA